MSRLYFTPLDKAFTLGSSQIKDTQEEIANLKKLILESSEKDPKKETKDKKINYERIGPPDKQVSTFRPPTEQDDINYNFLKISSHPRFDDLVKNYAMVYHPEWLLKETVYAPAQSISYFGNNYQSTVCGSVQRYIIFFIVSVVLFLALSIILK
jgi:hypothetical protein